MTYEIYAYHGVPNQAIWSRAAPLLTLSSPCLHNAIYLSGVNAKQLRTGRTPWVHWQKCGLKNNIEMINRQVYLLFIIYLIIFFVDYVRGKISFVINNKTLYVHSVQHGLSQNGITVIDHVLRWSRNTFQVNVVARRRWEGNNLVPPVSATSTQCW